jgi:hypothetical protein
MRFKLRLRSIKHFAMKTHGEIKVCLHVLLNSELHKGEWSVPAALLRRKYHSTPFGYDNG